MTRLHPPNNHGLSTRVPGYLMIRAWLTIGFLQIRAFPKPLFLSRIRCWGGGWPCHQKSSKQKNKTSSPRHSTESIILQARWRKPREGVPAEKVPGPGPTRSERNHALVLHWERCLGNVPKIFSQMVGLMAIYYQSLKTQLKQIQLRLLFFGCDATHGYVALTKKHDMFFFTLECCKSNGLISEYRYFVSKYHLQWVYFTQPKYIVYHIPNL